MEDVLVEEIGVRVPMIGAMEGVFSYVCWRCVIEGGGGGGSTLLCTRNLRPKACRRMYMATCDHTK